MPLYQSNGKFYWQDLSSSPNANEITKEKASSLGAFSPLPAGVTTIPLGSNVDTGAGANVNTGTSNAPVVPVRNPRDILVEEEQARIDSLAQTSQSELANNNRLQQEALDRELQRIDTETNQRIAEQQQTGKENLAKTRGINIRAGLSGSPFAEALKSEVTQTTEKAVTSERTRGGELKAKAQGAFNENIQKIEENYNARQAQIDTQRSGLFAKKVEFSDAQTKEAMDEFDLMAKSGQVDIQKLDNAGLLQGYATQTGQSVDYLKTRFLFQKPHDEALTSQMKRYGDNFLIPYKGANGVIRLESVKAPEGLPPEYKNVTYLQETGQLVYYGDDPSTPVKVVGGLPVKSTKVTTSELLSQASVAFESVKGQDGYINPQDWIKLRSAWLQQGGLLKDFEDNFGIYRNPNDTY